ncbi:MAG: hypothetical protein KC425_00210, partial [Anaerolineales bacterium]|nr:hypothetical protein [Anaerolineales bacterium]
MNRGFLKQLAYLFAINLACSALLMTWQAQAQERRAPAAPAGSSTGLVSYQGRLTDGSGRPLSGQYNLVFRLYDTPTGGTPLWEETWSGASAVSVSDGLFSLLLGSHNPTLPAAVAGHDTLYLGITVDTDAELSPRTQLGSAPIALYALQADVADGAVTTAKLADGAVTAAKLHPALQTTILRGFTPAVYSDRVSPEVSEG